MRHYYIRYVLGILTFIFICGTSFSQNKKSFWTKTTKEEASRKEQVFRKTQPKKAQFYNLDIDALKQVLALAPDRKLSSTPSTIIVDFPTAEGNFESFRIKEASVMEKSLQDKYSNIRTYIGQSIQNPSTLIRFSITPQGLHTMTLSERGAQFIDPYTKNGSEYIIYSKKDLPPLDQPWECGVIDEIEDNTVSDVDISLARNADDGMMREYRLAIACTIEYASFHWMAAGLTAGDSEAAKKAVVLAAMVITVNRNNQIYERDLSITMTLVANNENIIYINSDSFTNDNASALINESQTVIDGVIGSANYDIGHTFSTGGGGLAQLNSPCTSSKARGITGSPAPIGDPYDIDYVAHEMGHQYGAPHTFNGDAGSCAGNRTASNAYEPGSGSTIMAYAGICSPQNVQSNSDAYFHQKSLEMIWSNISTGNSSTCPNETSTGNSVPTANAGVDYAIPNSTPYKLTGSSTDPDGTSSHTYTWEQYDLGPAGLPVETNVTGPLVRSYEGTSNPTRYIPRMEDILSDGGASTTWEKLASVQRTQDFRLTVRDNDPNGGQTAFDVMTTNVRPAAGPFLVTSQNTDQLVLTPGSTETVTWDVAGTTGNGVNTANVNILLSTDGGDNFDTVLASNVTNNGSYNVTMPNISAPYCRIMVEGAGNIFFNVNDYFFAIGNYTYTTIDSCNDYTFNAGIAVPENSGSYSGYLLNIPDSYNITDVDIAVDITHNDNSDLYYAFRHPEYVGTAVVALASGVCAGSANADFVFDDEGAAINCSSTANGDNVTPQNPLSIADGTDSAGNWTFYITDVNVGDGNTATWNSTTITICTSEIVPVLAVDEFDFEDTFSVYPNPNNGEFTIKFNASNANDINIDVYDIRGRSVYNKLHENSSNQFNEKINLGSVQSGMYLLNVNDGNRTITKKIIVE